jgi:phospholipid/cholesterol/gamma-HCH transport system substrate-binding protein
VRARVSRARRRRRVPNWLVGVLVLVAIPVALYSAFTHAPPPPLNALIGPEGHKYSFVFRNADGVIPGISPVRIAGVDVGEVTSVGRGPADTATVEVELSGDALPLHTDATVQVRPRTFLEGNFFVEINPGSPSAPELPDGGSVPLNQTYGSVQLDQVLSTFTHGVREDFRGGIRGLGAAVDARAQRSLRAAAPLLAPLFRDFARVAEATRGLRPHDLSGAIRSAARVSAALDRRRAQLGNLVSSFAAVATALADRDRELRVSLAVLPRVLEAADPSLRALNAALPQVRALVAELRPGLRAAPPVLRSALPFTAQASALLSPPELPTLLRSLTPAVVDLAGAAPRLTSVLRALRPTSRCLLEIAAPTLLAEVPDGELSTGDPVYQDLAHSLVGLASATQNFDGNGYGLRYNAGFNEELFTFAPGSPLSGLIGFGDEAPLGSRPAVPNTPPPLRPDVVCTAAGGPPDLAAATGPGDLQPSGIAAPRLRGAPDLGSGEFRRRLERALREELR